MFIETVSNTSGRYHAIIHCIPFDETEAEIVPMVFKAGIENHYNNVYVILISIFFLICLPITHMHTHIYIHTYKAIFEADTEWGQSKDLIYTSKKGLRGSVSVHCYHFIMEYVSSSSLF